MKRATAARWSRLPDGVILMYYAGYGAAVFSPAPKSGSSLLSTLRYVSRLGSAQGCIQSQLRFQTLGSLKYKPISQGALKCLVYTVHFQLNSHIAGGGGVCVRWDGTGRDGMGGGELGEGGAGDRT